jgi:SAM-dependent methyltransferase
MSEPPRYHAQHRGDAANYASYYAGMDKTMRQKLAFVGAHFLLDAGSRIADMGCGSGSGSYQLALLNPQIHVIGVDISPESIRFAGERYKLPNLQFMVGDAAQPLFVGRPLDGILSSSTLHHVYTFSGYSHDAVRAALASHLQCLRENGIFVLRDFVNPAKDAHVLLELPDTPSRGNAVAELADADLLKLFARTARPLDKRCGAGFFLEEVDPRRPATRLFRLPHKWAAEFILRKDYRHDWDVEILEEYTYFTADEFADALRGAGGRLLCAGPYWNPWIVKNRFEGKVRLLDEGGQDLGWPATNFVAVTQRVRNGASLRLTERRSSEAAPSFLIVDSLKEEAGSVYDLIKRPHPVCDILPWRLADGGLWIAARHGYPRPITRAVPRGPTMIDGSRWGGYLIEPVTGMVDRDAADDAVAAVLMERAGIPQDAIVGIDAGLSYYPSPGGIDEVVGSLFVEVAAPLQVRLLSAAVSGFSMAGELREFNAQDLLRAAHVGVLPEARLEMNVYALMAKLAIPPDPFIGEMIDVADKPLPAATRRARLGELLARPAEAPFKQSGVRAGYLRLVRSVFADQAEENGLARTLAEQELEFVLPRERSINTVAALPVLRDGEILVGLETRRLPVPQIHEGNARILTAPAWRLGRDMTTLTQAREFVASEMGVGRDDVVPLGAAYFPSAGITPERVHPFVVRVAEAAVELPYDFVPLRELHAQMRALRDGHLLVASMRLLHAFGLWGKAGEIASG